MVGGGKRYPAAAICAPGLESVCHRELTALGCQPKPGGPGTVAFEATARQVYAANVWLRTASRIVVRLATFRATDFAHLQQRAADLDWSPWLADGVAPRFRVTATASKLYHTDAVAQRLHQVVGPPSLGQPEQLFVVRINRNNVTISADASGEALHRRSWRTELGPAPLRPTMAAALLLATGWEPSSGLVDPFCGSGTIAIEAALLAGDRPPGGDRAFAFQTWPCFEPGTWASVTGEVAAAARLLPVGRIRASDRDPAAVAAARANAARAGVASALDIQTRVVSHLGAAAGPGLVASNPPYGKRVPGGDLVPLYRRFGSVVNQRLGEGWGLAIVCADRKLARAADRRLAPVARFRHGGLPVEVFYRPVSTGGSARDGKPVADHEPRDQAGASETAPSRRRQPSPRPAHQPSPTTS